MQTISSGDSLRRGMYRRAPCRASRERCDISPTFRFNGFGIQLYGPGRIQFENDSYIGELSTVHAAEGCSVVIEEKCRISHNVRIYTETANADSDFVAGREDRIKGDVHIGCGVWIGTNVYIGPSIKIGSNSVVGANSVVTKDVPSNEIWGGVPARLIRVKR